MSQQFRSPGCYKLCHFKEISISLHWSVLLLLVLGGFVAIHSDFSLAEALLLVTGLLLSLLAHSAGHLLSMQIFGWKSKVITLLPFGERISLEDSSKKHLTAAPLHELVLVSFAGVIPNLIISLALIGESSIPFKILHWTSVSEALVAWNSLLVLVNLTPLIPFDFGGLLQLVAQRSQSSTRNDIFYIGQELFSIVLLVSGLLFGTPILAVVAVTSLLFVTREHYILRASFAARGQTIDKVTTPKENLSILQHNRTLRSAQRELLRSAQQAFPILHGEKLLGYVSRTDLRDAPVHLDGEDCYLMDLAETNFLCYAPEDMLESLLNDPHWNGKDPIMVAKDEEFFGIVTREQLFDFLVLRARSPHISQSLAPRKSREKRDAKNEE